MKIDPPHGSIIRLQAIIINNSQTCTCPDKQFESLLPAVLACDVQSRPAMEPPPIQPRTVPYQLRDSFEMAVPRRNHKWRPSGTAFNVRVRGFRQQDADAYPPEATVGRNVQCRFGLSVELVERYAELEERFEHLM
ncbi:hypothetical protein SGCOL_005043 [Colletotrichum sp. CLE4]